MWVAQLHLQLQLEQQGLSKQVGSELDGHSMQGADAVLNFRGLKGDLMPASSIVVLTFL